MQQNETCSCLSHLIAVSILHAETANEIRFIPKQQSLCWYVWDNTWAFAKGSLPNIRNNTQRYLDAIKCTLHFNVPQWPHCWLYTRNTANTICSHNKDYEPLQISILRSLVTLYHWPVKSSAQTLPSTEKLS